MGKKRLAVFGEEKDQRGKRSTQEKTPKTKAKPEKSTAGKPDKANKNSVKSGKPAETRDSLVRSGKQKGRLTDMGQKALQESEKVLAKEKEIAENKVRFSFQNVEKGTYGIRCFQDLNGDGKLNKGMFGPSEPWGMSWKEEKVLRWPGFDKISFEVNSDIKNLRIVLE